MGPRVPRARDESCARVCLRRVPRRRDVSSACRRQRHLPTMSSTKPKRGSQRLPLLRLASPDSARTRRLAEEARGGVDATHQGIHKTVLHRPRTRARRLRESTCAESGESQLGASSPPLTRAMLVPSCCPRASAAHSRAQAAWRQASASASLRHGPLLSRLLLRLTPPRLRCSSKRLHSSLSAPPPMSAPRAASQGRRRRAPRWRATSRARSRCRRCSSTSARSSTAPRRSSTSASRRPPPRR